MPRDEIVATCERYASSFGAPVREGVDVRQLAARPRRRLPASTRRPASCEADAVVVVHGRLSAAAPPGAAAGFPHERARSSTPATTAPGATSRRERCWSSAAARPAASSPRSCTRRAARCSSPAGGRRGCRGGPAAATSDLVGARDGLPRHARRLAARAGGAAGREPPRDRRTAAATTCTTARCTRLGVQLLGHLAGVDGQSRVTSHDDLADSVGWGDERYAEFAALVRAARRQAGMTDPELPDPPRFDAERAGATVDLDGFGVVDLHLRLPPRLPRWVRLPGVRRHGLPAHPRRREHRRPRPLLLRRPLPAQAQVRAAVRRGRGRRHRGPLDRGVARPSPTSFTDSLQNGCYNRSP